jgi:hypothetical protein
MKRWNETLVAVDSVRAQSFPIKEIIVAVDHNPELYACAPGSPRPTCTAATTSRPARTPWSFADDMEAVLSAVGPLPDDPWARS